jgi:hypothetical protein
MNIPIPQWMVNLWIAFGDWANAWVWKRGRLEVLRIDLLMVILFMFTTAFYWARFGVYGALQGGVMFIVIGALALFMRRGPTS